MTKNTDIGPKRKRDRRTGARGVEDPRHAPRLEALDHDLAQERYGEVLYTTLHDYRSDTRVIESLVHARVMAFQANHPESVLAIDAVAYDVFGLDWRDP